MSIKSKEHWDGRGILENYLHENETKAEREWGREGGR